MRSFCIAVAAMALMAAGALADPTATVTLDPSARYQTILGWGKSMPANPVPDLLRAQVIDRAVNDLGINRLRFEGLCGNRTNSRSWEWLNDNDDPQVINWAGFNTQLLDQRVEAWLLPWKRAVEARGEPFNVYVSPSFFHGGSTGDLPPWMAADPEEYAEWALALLTRLRDAHGVTADYYCICNEAGNGNVFTPAVVGRMAKALMPRLRAAGFPTMLQFPESVNAQVAWRYVEALREDPLLWQWVGLISYHWYGRDNQTYMARLSDFARSRGLPTAQTEFMSLTIDHLYDDLTIGGTSYWEVYGLAGPDYQAALSHVSSRTFRGGDWYWRFRQVSHYVRPGAVRVGCTSSDPALRCLGFEQGGAQTVVLINTARPLAARTVTVGGLTPGAYGVSGCVGREPYAEQGVAQVGVDGALEVNVPANAVVTVYSHGVSNLPPVMTQWVSDPNFLEAPASSLQLTCAATDPERDALSYAWSVAAQPAGARVALAQTGAPSVHADGLSVPGQYVFAASVERRRPHGEAGGPGGGVRRQPAARAGGRAQPPSRLGARQGRRHAVAQRRVGHREGPGDLPLERGQPAGRRVRHAGDAGRGGLPSGRHDAARRLRLPRPGERPDPHRERRPHGARLSLTLTRRPEGGTIPSITKGRM